MTTTTIDENKLNQFMGRAVGDIGAAMSAALVLIGDELGLYKAMAAAGPVTPGELAKRTETNERYVREWLNNQAAGGYVTYDASNSRYTLPPEQAAALADEASPAFIPGAFQVIAAAMKAAPRIAEAFHTGAGLDWGDQDPILFVGTERFFRSGYLGNLVSSWIPALTGVEEKLRARCPGRRRGLRARRVHHPDGADLSQVEFVGIDVHAASIETARRRARDAGVGDRVRFEVAGAQDFAGSDYDLVACFDCLHDMADPVGAARHIRQSLAKDGTWLLVEPFASDWRRGQPQSRSGGCSTAPRRCSASRARWRVTVRPWARKQARRACVR